MSLASEPFRTVPGGFSWERLRIQELEERIRSTRQSTICALNQMLDLKDLNTGVHSTRLAEWAVRVGRELGLNDGRLEDVEVAALLHDAGKVGVPDSILKKPGPLAPAEWRVMRMHPEAIVGGAAPRPRPGAGEPLCAPPPREATTAAGTRPAFAAGRSRSAPASSA